ncbi:type II secretion system GspH family protein [Pseudomonas silvicola]|nr:type II secretion system GspH family protein [Pseudomonas silvicola]
MKLRGAGFGLVEMLAALAVFALGCTVLLVAFGQAARTLEQVRASDRLSLVARSLMDDQRGQRLQAGERRGSEGALRWRLQISREPGPATLLPLWRLDLDVSEGRRSLRVSTLAVQAQPALDASR